MKLDRFLELATTYSLLDPSTRQQFADMVYNGAYVGDQMDVALGHILPFLRKCGQDLEGSEELVEKIIEYRGP